MPTKMMKSKTLVWAMVLLFSTMGVVSPTFAQIVTTEQLAASSELQMQRDALSERLMRDDVKQEMLAMGVDPASVQDRIDHLTAAEISQIQGQLDSMPAGAGALGTVAMVLLILILLEITGLIDVFPRI